METEITHMHLLIFIKVVLRRKWQSEKLRWFWVCGVLLLLLLRNRTNSDPKRIQKAYRTILLKNHPDKGGSPYLAAKVNQAKDILLGNTEAAKCCVCCKHTKQTVMHQYQHQSSLLRTCNDHQFWTSTAWIPLAPSRLEEELHRYIHTLRSTSILLYRRRRNWLCSGMHIFRSSDLRVREQPQYYIKLEVIQLFSFCGVFQKERHVRLIDSTEIERKNATL